MTPEPASPSPPPAQILATSEPEVVALSQFLIEGFQLPEAGRSALVPAPLRWRYFEPRGNWPGPRSLVVRDSDRFTAHIGVVTTAFVQPGQPAFNVSAVHPVDWLSTKQGGMLGTMVMLKAFGRADVQYSLGSTTSGQRILLGCGFKRICDVPLFYRFFKPAKREVWNLLHGKQSFPKNIVMFSLDMARSLAGRLEGARLPGLALKPVGEFTDEVETLFHSRPQNIICSSRSAALLNYFLRHPDGKFQGWMLERGGRNIGFALTHIIERDNLVQGKIADCFLAENDATLWTEAIGQLTDHLERSGCDIARTAASPPAMQSALRANGFFARGSGGFFLRDTRNLLPKNMPFHLTMLEGDASY